MRALLPLAVLLIILPACQSAKRVKPPKELPHSWQAAQVPETIANPAYTPRAPTLRGSLNIRPAAQMTSLWSSSPKSLFGDRRANQLGDILTVVIEIDEEAQLQNSVSTDRSAKKNLEVSSFFGLPELAAKILPTGASLKPAIDLTNTQNSTGQGNIKRKEKLALRLAVRVNDVLPNGYLSLFGRQEIIVNDEMRYLHLTGIVRTADISRLNTITYDKIADAKIFYGGRGQITSATEEKIGSKIVGKLLPF